MQSRRFGEDRRTLRVTWRASWLR